MLDGFMACIQAAEIPPEPPDGLSLDGHGNLFRHDWRTYIDARRECTEKYGMWAIVSNVLARQLSVWIAGRSVLEIMAGAGWLAKALATCGIEVTATDNHIMMRHRKNIKTVYPVCCLRAENAVQKIPADVLLVSWPPYGDAVIVEACELWGVSKPIVYIGEDEGGCNAPDEFFERFAVVEWLPLTSWDGIHDDVFIGYWKGKVR